MSAPEVERAVRQARHSPCPNAVVPMFAWSQTTDRAYEMACGSWACSYCRRKKRAAVALVVADGCPAAFVRDERVRFLTLTDGTGGEMTVRELYLAWNRLRASLRKLGYLREYAAVVETTKNGALHLHVVATERFAPQKLLSRLASQAGFGKVADIRQVKRGRRGGCGGVCRQAHGRLRRKGAGDRIALDRGGVGSGARGRSPRPRAVAGGRPAGRRDAPGASAAGLSARVIAQPTNDDCLTHLVGHLVGLLGRLAVGEQAD